MYYAILKNEEGNITKVVTCATSSVAKRASDWNFNDADGLFMIRELTLSRLAELYNSFAESPISKFSDRSSAARRTFALLEETELPAFHEARDETKVNKAKKPPRSVKNEFAYSTDNKNPMRPTSRSGKTIQHIIDNAGVNVREMLEQFPEYRIQAIYGAVRMGSVEIVSEEEHQKRQASGLWEKKDA